MQLLPLLTIPFLLCGISRVIQNRFGAQNNYRSPNIIYYENRSEPRIPPVLIDLIKFCPADEIDHNSVDEPDHNFVDENVFEDPANAIEHI